MGFTLDHDPHAGRRSVPLPVATSVNRMKVVGDLSLCVPATDAKRLRGLSRQAAAGLVKGKWQSCCSQCRASLETAVTFLEQKEPRLSVCERSRGACALLSKTITSASDYAGQVAEPAGAAAQPVAATVSVALPPPQTGMPPGPLGGAGGSAAVQEAQSRSAAEFFASVP